MTKLKGALVALGVAALTLGPASAALADFTVGGGESSLGPCDVYFPSATFYDSGKPKSFNAGRVDC